MLPEDDALCYNAEPMRLSVVIPAYNEDRTIAATVRDIAAYLAHQSYASEILVIDDGSRDTTAAAVEALRTTTPALRLLQMPHNAGKGAAVRRGVLAAQGEFVVFLDADNATRLREIENAWPALRQPHAIVIGSRTLPESVIVARQPWRRVLVGKIGNLLIQALLLPGLSDTQCGFKVFRTAEARELFTPLTTWRWGFDVEILARARRAGYRIVEIPVHWTDGPVSRVGRGDARRTLTELLRIRRVLTSRGGAKKPTLY